MSEVFSAEPILEPVQLTSVADTGPAVEWLWDGYLARGSTTLLTSMWKTGKTMLLSILLSRMAEGGAIAGRTLARGRAAIVSEEPLSMWRLRGEHLNLRDHLYFFCRPFRGLPTLKQWQQLIQALGDLHQRQHLDLVVIDPLAPFLPRWSEGLATLAQEALQPLQRLAESGLAVLLLHHPRKGDPPLGQAARGSGAFSGAAEIVVEMKSLGPPTNYDRRRRLAAFSRFNATPRELVIELNADGTDYLAHGDLGDVEFGGIWPELRLVLEYASEKLTRERILDNWITPDTKPNPGSLWRLLERAVANGLLKREGDGRRNSPFRYWLPYRVIKRGLPELPITTGFDIEPFEYLAPLGAK